MYTYLYAFDAMADAVEDMKPIYQDIYVGLYLSDGGYDNDDKTERE
ncbi:MAG: hypothetical protein ACI4SD_03025 [Suilimivivens sp.]